MYLTDQDIQALLDNELSSEDELKVMEALKEDSEMLRRYMAMRQQKKLLQLWWMREKEKAH